MIARVRRVAGPRALRVDHIGSTSVPGLLAKDVLDVQVVVPDLAAAEQAADDLAEAGLVRREGDCGTPRRTAGDCPRRSRRTPTPVAR